MALEGTKKTRNSKKKKGKEGQGLARSDRCLEAQQRYPNDPAILKTLRQ